MQWFDRSAVKPPRHLQSWEAERARYALRDFFNSDADTRSQTRTPKMRVELSHFSVKRALEDLFNRKCAFCESQTDVSPYRFRPASDALPVVRRGDAHLYYGWLENAWENIYPICAGCRPADSSYFPVAGNRARIPNPALFVAYAERSQGLWGDYPPEEQALLLEPCVEKQFDRHFTAEFSGVFVPITEAGRETIRHFKLNRPELVDARHKAYERYRYLLTAGNAKRFRSTFDVANLEFGGSWEICAMGTAAISLEVMEHRKLSPAVVPVSDAPSPQTGSTKVFEPEPEVMPRRLKLLQSIELKCFKGIEQLKLDIPRAAQSDIGSEADLRQPALLILGENATGKSSVLEAIALALSPQQVREHLPIDPRELPMNGDYMGAATFGQAPSATVRLTFDDETCELLTINNGKYKQRRRATLPPVFAYGAFRQYQQSSPDTSILGAVVNLFDSQRLLANPLEWLLELEDDDLKMAVRALRDVLSIEGGFQYIEPDKKLGKCFIVTQAPGSEVKVKTPLDLASSGYRSILAMVCDIIRGLMNPQVNPGFTTLKSAQAVVLIDEIEVHLHPRWKVQIMAALRNALPAVTFIVTTHDPLCLRGMNNGEVVVIHRVKNHGNAKLPIRIEQLTHLPDIGHLTIEQLLTSDFFSLISTDHPEAERKLTMTVTLMTELKSGKQSVDSLTAQQKDLLQTFESDVNRALPVGFSEAQRLVQEAVVEYLRQRRGRSAEQLKSLRKRSRERILKVLEGL